MSATPEQPGGPARAAGEPTGTARNDGDATYRYRHLCLGWVAVAAFTVLGLALELLHAFKAPFYLGVSNESRRLLWTLAHAHGTLLGLVNIALAASLRLMPARSPRAQAVASACLVAATVLLPAGFFLGGAFARAGDAGGGVVLGPLGGGLFLVSVVLTARQAIAAAADRKLRGGDDPSPPQIQ
jgi:hypothetical protein